MREPLDPWGPSDPLGEALHLVRMNGAFYCRSELSAPWGMTLPAMPGYLWFHVVTEGSARLEAEGATAQLRPGRLALVPHGAGHVLRGEPGTAAPDILALDREALSDRYEVLRHGGGGAPTRLLCGAVRFDHPAARDLVAALPPLLHVSASPASGAGDWVTGTLALMAAEARSARPGGEAVITRLADIVVIQAIREWIEHDPAARTGWLGALRDPQIGGAISRIHRDPGRAWTVAMLADELAMSRSSFAARFTELVGEPAMAYVTRWRMHVALAALHEERLTVAELAARLGYRSEAAFARAFKRVIGQPPGAVRAQRLAEDAALAAYAAHG
ncbi:MAG: AraC family transcriptional regulator [Solirubrobacteraceae bacterium]|nr:AraC family transcriptional regulator [Solirubrobacteraceae bacterium]